MWKLSVGCCGSAPAGGGAKCGGNRAQYSQMLGLSLLRVQPHDGGNDEHQMHN